MANQPTDLQIHTSTGAFDLDLETIVSLQHVNKSFGKGAVQTQIIYDVTVDIFSGEMTFIVGPSGCGKTTLISLMGGILNVDSGAVIVHGTGIHALKANEKASFRRKNIGFIFQQFNLVPALTAQENVAVPLLIQAVPRQKALDQAKVLLERVGLGDKLNYRPNQLSGGQQQRVSIARALITNPTLLISDEPTASLDRDTGQSVMALLKEIATQSHRAVIVVTHDNRIFDYADRMIEMEDGRIKAITALKK